MKVYVQGENSLIPLQSEVTADSVEEALGYTPANEDDLPDITNDDDDALYVTDSVGNVIARTDSDGFHAKAITVNDKDVESGLITDAERETWNNKPDLDCIDESADDTFCVTDSQGNRLFEINEEGTLVVDVKIGTEQKSVAEHIEDGDSHVTALDKEYWNDKSFGSLTDNPIRSDDDKVFYLTDNSGNILFKIDETGAHATELYIGGSPEGVSEAIESLQNAGYLTEIPAEYVTEEELEQKGYLTEVPSEYITETELENKGYLTEHQSLDGYAKTEDIPTTLSELMDDATHRTVTDTEKSNWNDKTFDSLTDSPISSDDDKVFYVTDNSGNVLFKIDENGAYGTELYLGTNGVGIAEAIKSLQDAGYLTEIPAEYVTETELENKGYLTEIPDEYVTETELEAKGYLTVHQSLDGYAKTSDIPTKVSQLDNDKGYLTEHQSLDGYAKTSDIPNELKDLKDDADHRTVTDTEKSTWNDKSNFSGKYEDLTGNVPSVPTKLSELTDDATHRVVTDTEKSSWNNKSEFSGAYADLTGKPTIPTVPTNVSAFTNDAKYVDESKLNEKVSQSEYEGHTSNRNVHIGDDIKLDDDKVLHVVDNSGNIIAKIDERGVHGAAFYVDDTDVRPCYEQMETYERGSTESSSYDGGNSTLALATTKTIAPEDLDNATVVIEWTTGASGSQVVYNTVTSDLSGSVSAKFNRTTLTDSDSNVIGYWFDLRTSYPNYNKTRMYIIYDYEAVNNLSGVTKYNFPSNGIFLGEAYYDVTNASPAYANYTIIKSITGNFLTKLDNKFLDLPNNEDFNDLKTWKEKVDNGILTVPMADEAEQAEYADEAGTANKLASGWAVSHTSSGSSYGAPRMTVGKAYLIAFIVSSKTYTVSFVYMGNNGYSSMSSAGYYCYYNLSTGTFGISNSSGSVTASGFYIREL